MKSNRTALKMTQYLAIIWLVIATFLSLYSTSPPSNHTPEVFVENRINDGQSYPCTDAVLTSSCSDHVGEFVYSVYDIFQSDTPVAELEFKLVRNNSALTAFTLLNRIISHQYYRSLLGRIF